MLDILLEYIPRITEGHYELIDQPHPVQIFHIFLTEWAEDIVIFEIFAETDNQIRLFHGYILIDGIDPESAFRREHTFPFIGQFYF